MPSLTQTIQLARNMGLRYVAFRSGFELRKRLGLFRKKFPQAPPRKSFVTLGTWRASHRFWGVSLHGAVKPAASTELPPAGRLLAGEFPFFSAQWVKLGTDYDWITNPDSGYRYDPELHWSEIKDYSEQAGDIKYVWEKSRFAYLYDVMRYDLLTGEDHSEWVFREISSWLKANKVNSGPNYRCSQEMSLRVLNWTYALHFYQDSTFLTEEIFGEIIHAIYWHLRHIQDNINFSMIAVRNNHAIAETLTLYLGALFYPFFSRSRPMENSREKMV